MDISAHNKTMSNRCGCLFYLMPEVQQVIAHDNFFPELKSQEDVQCTLHNTDRN